MAEKVSPLKPLGIEETIVQRLSLEELGKFDQVDYEPVNNETTRFILNMEGTTFKIHDTKMPFVKAGFILKGSDRLRNGFALSEGRRAPEGWEKGGKGIQFKIDVSYEPVYSSYSQDEFNRLYFMTKWICFKPISKFSTDNSTDINDNVNRICSLWLHMRDRLKQIEGNTKIDMQSYDDAFDYQENELDNTELHNLIELQAIVQQIEKLSDANKGKLLRLLHFRSTDLTTQFSSMTVGESKTKLRF